MPQTCFACDRPATSREHVPPACLFPEQKDAGGRDLRINLITVPACSDHNARKSGDDMYLLWVLSTNLPANTVAMNHAMTKVLRSHRDRPALGLSIMDGAKAVMTTDSATGKEYEAMALPLAEARLQAELDLIARGLYFAHFRAKWTGAVLTHADFVARLDADGSSAFDAVRLEVFQMAETLFAGAARYGENPEVFWYQVSNAEVSGICVMRLGFYGSCTATVFFGTPPA